MSLRMMLHLGSLYDSHAHASYSLPNKGAAQLVCLLISQVRLAKSGLHLDPDRISSCHTVQYRKSVFEVIHCSTFDNFPYCRTSYFGPDITACHARER